jgi:2-polyprenyl-6-hydroxyphenyl methylase/3-demethylubiquinone-9 3-methyltransferase
MSEPAADQAGYGWTEETPESSSYINPVVLDLARRSGARRVLDAGCGNGELAGLLAADGFTVSGFDADAEGVAIARQRYPAVQFEVGTFDRPPREQVELVVATEVVEHLYAPHEFASFCFAALQPGGTLVVSTPYHGFVKNLALSLADKWDAHHTALWHGGHIKFWSRRTLGELLSRAGFEVTGFVGVGRAPLLWKSMILIARKPA